MRDAREVLPESAVFKNRAGSYASFADLFRYELLQRFGGLWSDTDVIAVAPAASLPDAPFLVPPAYANPIPHWECPARLLAPNGTMPEGTAFLHCYNETWREAKIDKNAPFTKGSLMADLAERYL